MQSSVPQSQPSSSSVDGLKNSCNWSGGSIQPLPRLQCEAESESSALPSSSATSSFKCVLPLTPIVQLPVTSNFASALTVDLNHPSFTNSPPPPFSPLSLKSSSSTSSLSSCASDSAPFWLGTEDALHIAKILAFYSQLLSPRAPNSRAPLEFVGSVKRMELLPKLCDSKSQLTSAVDSKSSSSSSAASPVPSSASSSPSAYSNSFMSMACSPSPFLQPYKTIETLDEITICLRCARQIGSIMPVFKVAYGITTWCFNEGIPLSFTKLEQNEYVKARDRVVPSARSYFLYALPIYDSINEYEYVSSETIREIGFSSGFSHCIFESLKGVPVPGRVDDNEPDFEDDDDPQPEQPASASCLLDLSVLICFEESKGESKLDEKNGENEKDANEEEEEEEEEEGEEEEEEEEEDDDDDEEEDEEEEESDSEEEEESTK